MAEPLPPIPAPPADAPWPDQFAYATAVTRHADAVANTAALTEQARQAGNGVTALQNATALQGAIYTPTKAERFWQALMCQFSADESGLMRRDQGVGNMATWADQAVAEFESRFPDTPPA